MAAAAKTEANQTTASASGPAGAPGVASTGGPKPPASLHGLTAEEVRAAQAAGNVNVDASVKTRSYATIFRENICTLFNLINVILAVFVFITGSYKNMLFMLVIVINTAIGIAQEIRSKITTDRLSIVVAASVDVLRDGRLQTLPIDQLVLGDVMRLGRGDQIPTDACVLDGECKVDESLLTGESKLISKRPGSKLFSGSFINSGTVWARVERVGANSYAAKITNEAKQRKAINSEIMTSLNAIIKYVSLFMFPVGALLFANEFFLHHVALDPAILSTVSALVGMIPEGLILLASTVMAVAVVRLAGHKVLVQQLYCIETLARVDVLCLDKTGTITTGGMEMFDLVPCATEVEEQQPANASSTREQPANVSSTREQPTKAGKAAANAMNVPANMASVAIASGEPANAAAPTVVPTAVPAGADSQELARVLASLVATDADPNDTALAIQRYFGLAPASAQPTKKAAASAVSTNSAPSSTQSANSAAISSPTSVAANPMPTNLLKPTRVIPFSSDTKWSGATFADGSSYVFGAAQFVLATSPDALKQIEPQLNKLAADARVLLVARIDAFTADGKIEGSVEPLGFACIRDQIRSTAAQTIRYFIDQGVTLKVISGDDPHTVSGIAQKVGVPGAQNYVDATTLKSDEDIAAAIQKYSVFGRVRPEQKKAFVLALQAQGHTVAMTGDGVNDVLALKASDCSVAMASGSDAARNVAQLVLVNNDFASMPAVVAEGRRSINNLQRSASLFLVKTLLSITAAFLFIFLPWQYPFVPIQMTLISAFTIGIPSFVLALEPNKDRVRGRFLLNCVVHSIPGAICAVVSIVIVTVVGNEVFDLSYGQVSTLCVLLVAVLGIMLVIRLSMPYTPLRWALLVVVVGGTVLGVTVFGWLFDIATFVPVMWWIFGIGTAANLVVFNILYNVLDAYHARKLAVYV